MRKVITTSILPLCIGFALSGLAPSNSYAQSQNTQTAQKHQPIRGVVLDEQGRPLVGATIQIKGQKGGCITESNGSFEIRPLAEQAELQISYIGFKTKLRKAKAGDKLRITLEEEATSIEQVVITGFTAKKKSSYTGAHTTIKRSELLSRGTKNLLQSLETLVPGMVLVENNDLGSNPNARPEFNIHGRASFEGKANMPIFIVDGSEVTADYIYDMDMNDIENVTVLTDASASALYGAKASAGVIVITTKALEGGRLKLNYNGTMRLSVPDLSEYHLLNASQKLEYERLAGIYSSTRPEEQYTLDKEYARLYGIVQSGVNTDWLSKPLRNGVSQSHSLSIDGGDTHAKYSVGVRYGSDAGVMIGSQRDRLSGNFKLSYDVPQKFHITNTFTVTTTQSEESPYGTFSDYVRQNPYDSPYDAEGNLRPTLSNRNANPLYEASIGNYNRAETFDFMNNTNMHYWIGKSLRINADFSIQKSKNGRNDFVSPKSRSELMRDIEDPAQKGRLMEVNSKSLSYQGKVMASYNQYFFGKLYTSSVAGMSFDSQDYTSSNYVSIGYYTSKLAHPAFATRYPASGGPSGEDGRSTGVGFFANLNGIWDNKYFLDVIYRYEGSSKFGRDKRFAPFWSVGAGWNIHNEGFMTSAKSFVSLLKLRASIGYLGNISFDPYQAMTTYSYAKGLNYTKGVGAIPITIGNPDLKWERTLNANIGLDLTLWGGRLDLSANYYIKNTDNLLLDVTKAPSVGIVSARENLGSIENKGFDLRASVTALKSKDLQWVLSLNLSHNVNKIKQISNALKSQNEANLNNSKVRTPLPIYEEGESLSALKVVPSAGIDPATGQEIYIKRDGSYTFVYDAHDKVTFGDTAPSVYGSLNSYLTWKGFSLGAAFSFSLGGAIYNETLVTRVEGADPRYNADERVFSDRWRKPGDQSKYKDIADRTIPLQTSRFVETNNFLTLKSLSLAYDIPSKVTDMFKLKRMRVEFITNNLFYLSSVKQERGLSYPYDRSFELSLRFTL